MGGLIHMSVDFGANKGDFQSFLLPLLRFNPLNPIELKVGRAIGLVRLSDRTGHKLKVC
jgi:hypothetical protein